MGDDVSARLGLDATDWGKGLDAARLHATAFMAFMENMNVAMLKLQGGSYSAAEAIAAIGGVGAEAQDTIRSMAAAGQSAGNIMSALGADAQAVNAETVRLIEGNSNVEQSLSKMGLAFKKERIEEQLFVEARRKLEAQIAAIQGKSASSRRGAVLGPDGEPAVRGRSADVYMSKDPMDYDNARDIALARKIQKIKEAADAAGMAVKLPLIEMGDDKARINMARLAMTWENLNKEIRAVAAAEKEVISTERALDRQAKETFTAMARGMRTYVATINEARAASQKLLKESIRRQGDQMFQTMDPAVARKYITPPSASIFGNLFGAGGKLESKFVDGVFKNIERGSQLASKGVMSLVRSLSSAGSSMAFMTASIGGLFAIMTGATIGATFKMAADFEHAMKKIMILVKEGETTLPRLTDQVKDFSKAFGMSPMSSAEGFRIAISSDVPPGEIMKFMEEAGKLAVTHSASIEKTADMMSMMRNAFNLTVKDMSRLRDMIFVMTDRGRVEVEQFAGEIGKISSVAALAGVNMQEMLAGFAALSRTKGPEQAGTMLINLFKLITKQGPEAKKILKDLQITLSPEQTKAEGMVKQIEKIHDALLKNPQVVEQITDDFRELRAWGEITGSQFDALKSIYQDMFDSVGEGDKHFGEMMNTTEVRWNRMMAQMRISAMEMGTAVMASFNEWVDESGGVEAAQQKIASGFKRIELAARYFLGAIEFVGTGVMAILSSIGTVVYSVFKGFEIGAKMVKGMFLSLSEKSVLGELQQVNDQVERLRIQLGNRDEPILKKQLDDATKKARELQDKLTEIHDEQRTGVNALSKTFEEWGNGVTNIFKPTVAIAKALGENADKIHQLQQEIADLDVVMKNSAEDHEAMKRYQESLTVKTKAATEAIRDQAKAMKELVINQLREQVQEGKSLLKDWLHDNTDTIKGIIAGYRKLATEQEALTKQLKAQLKDLTKDRERFDDGINKSIDKIKDQDRKPSEIFKNRIDQGQILEAKANTMAKLGDRDEVQRLVKEAADMYESILSIDGSNTKENRKTVVDALERLKGEMDKVYDAEQTATQKRIDTAEKATKTFTAKANEVEAHFKAFSQGITDLTRDIEKLGAAPSEEALKGLKEKILKLMGDSQYFIDIQTDPALAALDKMIEKAKALKMELSAVPEFLLKGLSDDAMNQFLLRGTPGGAPVEPSNTSNNTSNTTNVDMSGTTINAGGEGGTKEADGRRLARIIKRHIERGEAPSLAK